MTGMATHDLHGKRVLVYSLGIEGQDLARWALAQGASVVMSDTRADTQLVAADAVAPAGVEAVISGKPFADAAGFDLLAVSQSVLRTDAAVVRARALGVPVTSQMQLFLQLCPGRVVGITGSSGKSTTTALAGAMAAEAGIEHMVGGNIGAAMLGRLPEITPATTVILEISHTQLQYTDRSPAIAAVTNVTPNHLDQFPWDEYVGLKKSILRYQGTDGIAILNADDPVSETFVADVRGRLLRTSLRGEVAGDGTWLADGTVWLRRDGETTKVLERDAVRLRGEHNLANIVMACAVASAVDIPVDAMAKATRAFQGVPHRLEVVGRAGGVTWVNDSIATSPERTMAGIRAFREPVVLLLGGRDKNLPLEGLQALARERCRAVVCFGESGALFAEAMADAVADCTGVPNLEAAVEAAVTKAVPGDIVLLAPGGTSFDAYPNFEARGRAFRELVRALPGFEEEAA